MGNLQDSLQVAVSRSPTENLRLQFVADTALRRRGSFHHEAHPRWNNPSLKQGLPIPHLDNHQWHLRVLLLQMILVEKTQPPKVHYHPELHHLPNSC